jgi:thymidylate synthase (FAD)
MQILSQSHEIMSNIDGTQILKHIELCGRTCYKSEGKITDDSHKAFVNMICNVKKHDSVLEHHSISVRFITDRAVSMELIRHRIAAYSQESQRYCNYSQDKFGNDVTFIKPRWCDEMSHNYIIWKNSCENSEKIYFELLAHGVKPENARSVLPNCTKTEIVMTANLREWRHVLKLRTSKQAHPDMQALMKLLLAEFKDQIPLVFDDIGNENLSNDAKA